MAFYLKKEQSSVSLSLSPLRSSSLPAIVLKSFRVSFICFSCKIERQSERERDSLSVTIVAKETAYVHHSFGN